MNINFFYFGVSLALNWKIRRGQKLKLNLIFFKNLLNILHVTSQFLMHICSPLLSSIFLIDFKETVFYSISVYIFQKFLDHSQNALKDDLTDQKDSLLQFKSTEIHSILNNIKLWKEKQLFPLYLVVIFALYNHSWSSKKFSSTEHRSIPDLALFNWISSRGFWRP